ncbi:hypothetical protein J2X69_000946 [Algoriphagus sp. 4150]|uniref:DUF4221 family protein n=1 Tax=Algoriphagus sp. 4150 TaxID=2817756 RepID=UPI00285CF824|nr:DUF4221 family protein [Algoriphagus sp. 4150]MDR7128614.1 hypothetical protein [Algoriphagus sp. 4150]
MKYLVFLLIPWLFLSCSRSQEYRKLELIPKRLVEIPIDDQTSTNWWFMQAINLKGEEYLAYHDMIRAKKRFIHFAHIADPEKSFKVQLALEGPEGIGALDGFHIRNLDSIFVLNQYKYELNLVDTSGRIKSRYRLRSDDSNRPSQETALPTLWTYAPIIDLGTKLMISSMPDIDPFKNGYKQKNLSMILDLESKAFGYHLGYSDKYMESGFWGVMLEMPSYTVNYKDSVILQSFPIEERVMVYDFDLNLLKSPALFSQLYEGRFHSLPKFDLDPSIFYQHIYTNPKNNMILYDSYRNLYYRVMSGPYPDETIKHLIETKSLGDNKKGRLPERTIMVFDEDFRELGVVELDRDNYYVDFIRVVKEGLLIEVQTDDEDKKVFQLFEVKL